jgi:hypothetical protein
MLPVGCSRYARNGRHRLDTPTARHGVVASVAYEWHETFCDPATGQDMANRHGIPATIERGIRARDVRCVYSRKVMAIPVAVPLAPIGRPSRISTPAAVLVPRWTDRGRLRDRMVAMQPHGSSRQAAVHVRRTAGCCRHRRASDQRLPRTTYLLGARIIVSELTADCARRDAAALTERCDVLFPELRQLFPAR